MYIKLSMNKEAKKRITCFSPVITDKTVGNCQSHYFRERFCRSHVTRPPCLRKFPRPLLGYMTNNLFSPLFMFTAKQSQQTPTLLMCYSNTPWLLNKGIVCFAQPFWECGYYSRAATNQGWRSIAEIGYVKRS